MGDRSGDVWPRVRRSIAMLAAFAGCAFGTALSASAQPVAPQPGLPMWVVRDADSTIYITGTVHILPDNAQWRSEKLDAAFASASELRLELAEIADSAVMDAAMKGMIAQHGAYDGPPLTSFLTDVENEALKAQLAAVDAPEGTLAIIDTHQPWVAMQFLGRDYRTGGVYKFENGIDNSLARLAAARGMPVRGMESLDVQIALVSDASFDEQLAGLRYMLTPSPAAQKQQLRLIDLAFGSWLRGETHPAEALVILAKLGSSLGNADGDVLLKNRNENWAAEIQDMLKGAGVSFIAVGAAHLVGPDSLQTRLKLRGITAERY